MTDAPIPDHQLLIEAMMDLGLQVDAVVNLAAAYAMGDADPPEGMDGLPELLEGIESVKRDPVLSQLADGRDVHSLVWVNGHTGNVWVFTAPSHGVDDDGRHGRRYYAAYQDDDRPTTKVLRTAVNWARAMQEANRGRADE